MMGRNVGWGNGASPGGVKGEKISILQAIADGVRRRPNNVGVSY